MTERSRLADLEMRGDFIRRHIGPDREQIATMVAALGLDSLEEIVAAARLKGRSGRPGRTLRQMEEETLRALLADHRGDTAKVAAVLGIDRSTVYRKARRFGIDLKAWRRA